jgi:hypothetical protein
VFPQSSDLNKSRFLHTQNPRSMNRIHAALLPTFGAFLLISAEGSWFNRQVLSARWVVFIGLISYPLYLWHWPLLAFVRIFAEEQPNKIVQSFLILISLLLAWLTYCLIERPVRFGKAKQTIAPLCVAMLSIGVLGLFIVRSGGVPSRFPDYPIQTDAKPDVDVDWRQHTCFLTNEQDQTAFRTECNDTARRPLVFLWGDSAAASIYLGLRNLSKTIPFGVSQFTASRCPPLLSHVQYDRPYCKGINDFVFEQIKQTLPDIVALNSMWDYENSKFDYTITELKRAGIKRIVVLGPLVAWAQGLPRAIVDYYYKDARHSPMPERTKFRVYGEDSDAQIRQKAHDNDVEYVSVWDVFCNQDGCLTRIDNNQLTTWDSFHLTVAGSDFLANAIKSRLFPKLPPAAAVKSQ